MLLPTLILGPAVGVPVNRCYPKFLVLAAEAGIALGKPSGTARSTKSSVPYPVSSPISKMAPGRGGLSVPSVSYPYSPKLLLNFGDAFDAFLFNKCRVYLLAFPI